MAIPPKRPTLTATPAMKQAADKAVPSISAIRAKPRSRLEQNTRVGHVYWCSFSEHNWPPEFDAPHLVVVIRGGQQHDGSHVVVPLTKRAQTGEFSYRLKGNPNPRSAPETWAVCDHIYTVASARLAPLRDDNGNYRRAVAVHPDDLVEIGRRMFESLNTIRRATFGPAPKKAEDPSA
ncbi:MAG: type II toxin-antitoxin system PemK/MazF family toxin [Caulobacterales bacterium]|nr:type II toxin-antitoxin system PemK/MazF family toxin [Caulobacterales bacterium]